MMFLDRRRPALFPAKKISTSVNNTFLDTLPSVCVLEMRVRGLLMRLRNWFLHCLGLSFGLLPFEEIPAFYLKEVSAEACTKVAGLSHILVNCAAA